MVEILVYRGRGGKVAGLSVDGHAGFSDEEHGGDIVCAAVSALVGYLGIMFSEVRAGIVVVGADDGHFSLEALEAAFEDGCYGAVLEGWIRSVKQLEENYKGWVKVEERTV